ILIIRLPPLRCVCAIAVLPSRFLSARAAFQVNSSAVFKEDVDIVPVFIDDTLSYVHQPLRGSSVVIAVEVVNA
ncbi:MAG: hypothetical protein ACI30L_01260, partial [Muribaculaceae bacterium]